MPFLSVSEALQQAVRLHQSGRLAEAEGIYRQVLSRRPDNVDALHLLGVLCNQRGEHATAQELIARALAIQPGAAGIHNNFATVLREARQFARAEAHVRRAIELQPGNAEFHANLGQTLAVQGRLDAAQEAYGEAVRLNPNLVTAHAGLGTVLRAMERPREAAAQLRRAVELSSNDATLCTRLGEVLMSLHRIQEAIALFQRAAALAPDFAEAYAELAGAYEFECRADDAIAAYRKAIALNPRLEKAHSYLLYALLRHPGYTPRQIFEEHLRWGEQHARPLERTATPHANDRNPDRRLRVAYVGPFFKEHVMSRFIEPMLAHHDHERFEVFCYSDVARGDAVTERIRRTCDHWRDTFGLDDAQLAEQIRNDRIDVLFDPCGHLGGNRLLTLARRPAPVQITWLGYQATTGLRSIDYVLSDDDADPPGTTEHLYTEKLLRIPELFWTWSPPAASEAPEVNALPAMANGHVTFGSFNHIAKVNRPLVATWCAVLRAVPDSRMLVLGADEQSGVNLRLQDWFSAGGIPPERVRVEPRRPKREYLHLMNEVDVALDTFPFNGHTTTLECLWMGLPVVHRSGETFVQRYGAGPLRAIGLDEFVTRSAEDYVHKAVEVAGDLRRLAELRSGLRERVAGSLITDHRTFTRRLEDAYRRVWTEWCRSGA